VTPGACDSNTPVSKATTPFSNAESSWASQEATDIYKRLLLENRDYTALNVYVALCYYKLDYYDVSLEILAAYLQVQFRSFRLVFLVFSTGSGTQESQKVNSKSVV